MLTSLVTRSFQDILSAPTSLYFLRLRLIQMHVERLHHKYVPERAADQLSVTRVCRREKIEGPQPQLAWESCGAVHSRRCLRSELLLFLTDLAETEEPRNSTAQYIFKTRFERG